MGRSSTICAFHPAELNSGYHALIVEILVEVVNAPGSPLHLRHRAGSAEFGAITNIIPSRQTCSVAGADKYSSVAAGGGGKTSLGLNSSDCVMVDHCNYPIHRLSRQERSPTSQTQHD